MELINSEQVQSKQYKKYTRKETKFHKNSRLQQDKGQKSGN
jgi:hypothetical protein